MRQLLQSLKTGNVFIEDVPVPKCGDGQVLIETTYSLISSGTERMLLEFGKGNLFQKARLQPEKVKMVIEKGLTDGFAATLETVKSKLDSPVELGYSNVGKVIESRIDGFSVGDRVVSNGKHSEFVTAKKNLIAKIPENVSDEFASFTVLAAISLHAIRLAKPTIGEYIVVQGLNNWFNYCSIITFKWV